MSLIESLKPNFSFSGVAVSLALERGLEMASNLEGRLFKISFSRSSD